MKKRNIYKAKVVAAAARVAKFLLKSQLFTVLLVLCSVGYWAGTQARPDPGTVPYEELFENLSVVSYRDAPSDSTAKFVVELAARGRVFRQYDIDSRRFIVPVQGHDYRRSITGTRYPPMNVQGHVNRGFWFELPSTPTPGIRLDQFEELYRSTAEYLKPVAITASVLAVLSGYSTGYRMAMWSGSLANPKVQDRVLAVPDIGRVISREAWRRVLLEPVVVGHESDATRFASVRGMQRVYTNFFRLALNDSDSFIPREEARLDSAGHRGEARAMHAFVRAVRRAAQDTSSLSSADFAAIEEWASLLDRRGHWAEGTTPPSGEERMKYLGTLSWYGVAPTASGEQRIWVGPRVLVRIGETDGFVADEIPLSPVGCPIAWREWLRDDSMGMSGNAWTAQWMGGMRQFKPIVQAGRWVAQLVGGGSERNEAARLARHEPNSPTPTSESRGNSDPGTPAARVSTGSDSGAAGRSTGLDLQAAGRGALPSARTAAPLRPSDLDRAAPVETSGAVDALGPDSVAGEEIAHGAAPYRAKADSTAHAPDPPVMWGE